MTIVSTVGQHRVYLKRLHDQLGQWVLSRIMFHYVVQND